MPDVESKTWIRDLVAGRLVPYKRAELAVAHASVLAHGTYDLPDHVTVEAEPVLVERWNTLVALREQVLAEIEPLRKNKQIGSSLQARVVISATSSELPLLEQYARQLPMLFIVSAVELRRAPTDGAGSSGAAPRITIERAAGVKCERCWRMVPAVSGEPASAGLCDRCQDALAEAVHG
jgi:isoleucyl-tRNA synthetase